MMQRRNTQRRWGLAWGAALVVFLLGFGSTGLAQGPFSAQIQQALQAFLRLPHTWTAVQTFSGGIIGNPCPGDGTTVIKQVTTNDLGIYTGATACATGTLRFAVSATAVTSEVQLILPVGSAAAPAFVFTGTNFGPFYTTNAYNLGSGGAARYRFSASAFDALSDTAAIRLGSGQDAIIRRSAAKTLTTDADGAGGALTLVDVKGPLSASARLIVGTNDASTTTGVSMGLSGNATFGAAFSKGDGSALIGIQAQNVTINSAGNMRLFFSDSNGTLLTSAALTWSGTVLAATTLNAPTSYQINGALLVSATAPTVAAGFGSTTPGTVTHNTGTQVIMVTVGTNAGGTTGSLTLPSAPTGWACELHDVTNTADLTRQTGYTQTTAAFSTTVAWTTGDVLVGLCGPF